MGEEIMIFLLHALVKAEDIHSLWHQKLLEVSLLSVHKGENFPQIGKTKKYHICSLQQACKSELQHHGRTWSQYDRRWSNQKTISWEGSGFTFSVVQRFIRLTWPFLRNNRQIWLAGNSSSQNHKAFLWVGRGNLTALSHRNLPGVMF